MTTQPNIRFPCFHWNFLLTIYTCINHILLISKPRRLFKTPKHFCETVQPWRSSQPKTKILQISWPISRFTQFIWRFFWETKLSSAFLKFSFFSWPLSDGGRWSMEVWVWRFQIIRFCWWVSNLGIGFVVQIYDLVVSDLVLVVGFVFGFSSSALRPLDFASTRIDYPYLWFRIWLLFIWACLY